MGSKRRILVFGASYGSLLAAKLLGAGHMVTLVCRPATARLINAEGIRVRIPLSSGGEVVEVDSRRLPGNLSASTPSGIDFAEYDLVVLAMQEPQYCAPELRESLAEVARAALPCMSIMNMPPLPYLCRVPGLDVESLRTAYTDATVWNGFDPALVTLCSPDPQAFRPETEKPNVLQVRLATNFKTAKFASETHNSMLAGLQDDVETARFPIGDQAIALPVKLKVHDSLFVPFAKWAMLLTGNYRCIQAHAMRSIAAAVNEDGATARGVYEWVTQVCRKLGADDEGSRGIRQVRERRLVAQCAIVGGTGACGWRRAHRARRPAGSGRRRQSRNAIGRGRPHRRRGRFLGGVEPAQATCAATGSRNPRAAA